MHSNIFCVIYILFCRRHLNPEIWRDFEEIHPVHAPISIGGEKGGEGGRWLATVRVHVSRSFFSDYPTGASLIRVSTFFVFLALFSREVAGRILCLYPEFLLQEERGESPQSGGGRRDSSHCGTIWTKVAIATKFKGAEEWWLMQIEAFSLLPAGLVQYS